MGAPSSPAAPAAEATPPIRRRLLSDERLARLVEDGSERAFAMIYERYHQRLYRYCRSLLRDGDDAYDALQSTLANALAALQRGRRDAPLRPWLFRIAHNESISIIRRREPGRGSFEAAESCVPSAETRADERARLALLVADLGELPERQRAVLLMRELNGLSRQDIASALGLSMQTVGRALLAARRSLGEFEEGRAMVCEQVQRSISLGDGKLPRRARAHVRDCSACATFAAAIPTRRADLKALAPPLAPIPAAALLALVHGASSSHGAGGGITAAGLSGKTAGAALAAKALASVAIVAVASASAAGLTSKLTGAGEPSLSASSPARAGAEKRHLPHPVRAGAPRASRDAALAPARLDVTPTSAGGSAGDSPGNTPGVPSERTGAAGAGSAAVSPQPHPPRGGVPVHAEHPHGASAGALHGKPAAGARHARGAGTGSGAASANGSGAGREPPSASSAGGRAGGGQGRPGEPASADEAHGRPVEASNAPRRQSEPPSPAGDGQSPPAQEEAGSQDLGAQHGGGGAASAAQSSAG